MLHRVRLVTRSGGFGRLYGEIGVDETFIGGRARNMHLDKRTAGRGAKDKAAIPGFLRRSGGTQAEVVSNRKGRTPQSMARGHVARNSIGYTHELSSHEGPDDEFVHQIVNHAVGYVGGGVYTNGLENSWALLRHGIRRAWVSAQPFHPACYLDEETYRHNNRDEEFGDAGRFSSALARIAAKRLTCDGQASTAALEKQRHMLN
jgi:hypothetical protein